MKKFYRTEEINAKPMNKLDYNIFRCLDLPSDEIGRDEGYLVEYLDGGRANTDEFKGYVSWSPKDVFEKAYRSSGSMTFGDALVAIKAGRKVARSGWNGKNMFIFLANRPTISKIYEEGIEIKYQPHIDMKTADNTIVPWLASQSDVLANDWIELT